jgi:hypothetical protein
LVILFILNRKPSAAKNQPGRAENESLLAKLGMLMAYYGSVDGAIYFGLLNGSPLVDIGNQS